MPLSISSRRTNDFQQSQNQTFSPETSPPESSQKRRRAVTLVERQAIRDYNTNYKQQWGKACPQKEMQEWFHEQFNHLVSQSTISDSLHPRYSHLDTHKVQPDQKRMRLSHWPDLEQALFEWQQRMELKHATLTNDLLIETALQFWRRLPQYQSLPEPRFSVGWLAGFKQRHGIKRQRKHGEGASVDAATVEAELVELRELLKDYELDDIYNMNETAIFWKANPDATQKSPGGKTEKARITANFACNVTGTRKLVPWIIGKAKKPRCFKGINIANLPIEWRWNTNAWMTGRVFKEYLLWFDSQMSGRKVVLLIDGFSAHYLGLNLVENEFPNPLPNTKVVFLPTNGTSLCQPLDLGIIRTFKAYYRSQWLRYQVAEYQANRMPEKTVNVLKAIRWAISAWDDVSPSIIHSCWVKARVLGPNHGLQLQSEAIAAGWKGAVQVDEATMSSTLSDIRSSMTYLVKQQRVRATMSIDSFLNPIEETVDDHDDIVHAIVQQYAPAESRDHETDEEEEVIPDVTCEEALFSLRQLRLYEEQQDHGDTKMIQQLNEYEKVIKSRGHHPHRQQASITSYFGR